MEDNKQIIVVVTAGGIEIIVEDERIEDTYTLALSKPQATGHRTCFKHSEHHIQDRSKTITNY